MANLLLLWDLEASIFEATIHKIAFVIVSSNTN